MKLVTKTPILNLKGEAIKSGEETLTIGNTISSVLLNAKSGGKMKLFVLAQKCFTEEEVDIDVVDMALIKAAVEQAEGFNNLITGQLLLALEEAGKE